ncbi:MAG: TIGR03905 family TSCPD domain-containing protein [Bacillales bacterium]|nr:TIGR03905 family TSCPD domain-containing protein [Bacillales bacterium]
MVKHLTYVPTGVCSRRYEIDYEDGKIVKIEIVGGCNGNLSGISKLLEGADIDWVISRLEGTKCGFKQTSCPDQIAKALKTIK